MALDNRTLAQGDSSPGRTFTRAEAIAKLWAGLPNPPGSATPFVAGMLSLAQFQVLVAALSAKLGTLAPCE